MRRCVAAVWALTQGQPWLVNALAYETCFRMPEGRDRAQPITAEMVYTAKENLILRRETHLDQLTRQAQRSARASGDRGDADRAANAERCGQEDDLQLCDRPGADTAHSPRSPIANPIYGEIIPRELDLRHAEYNLAEHRCGLVRAP